MRKRIISVTLIIVCLVIMVMLSLRTSAKELDNPYGEPFKIRCTCYHYTGSKGANGRYPNEKLSVAGKKEWLGMVCAMYECDSDGNCGDFIGLYEFTDTGYGMDVPNSDKGSIESGDSIDKYMETLEDCQDWIAEYGDYVYIQVIDAKG